MADDRSKTVLAEDPVPSRTTDLPRSPKAAYWMGRSDERDRCIRLVKKWFGGDDSSERGYELVREMANDR